MTATVIDFRVRLPIDLRPPLEVPPAVADQYDAVLGTSTSLKRTLADLKEEMAENGVEHAIVHAEFEFGDPADALNAAVAQLIQDVRFEIDRIQAITRGSRRSRPCYRARFHA